MISEKEIIEYYQTIHTRLTEYNNKLDELKHNPEFKQDLEYYSELYKIAIAQLITLSYILQINIPSSYLLHQLPPGSPSFIPVTTTTPAEDII